MSVQTGGVIPPLSVIQGQRIRRSLLAMVERAIPDYRAGWVHREICEKLEGFLADLEAGKRPRLAIFLPPRHGKSTLASRLFPSWYLGHRPQDEVMVVSYSAELANSFSYDCRAIVTSDWYQEAFPEMRLVGDRKGVTRWRTTRGGGLNPGGIGSSLTGAGCTLLILDDLYKSEQQAYSASHRQMVHDRYRSSIYTRLSPMGGILMLQTVWHEDDLGSRLLADGEAGKGDAWEVVRYPAIATKDEKHRKKGEALHPERFPVEMLRKIQKVSGPSEWAALYQQDPLPMGGDFFRREWIKHYQPSELLDPKWVWDHVVISLDTAFAKRTSDRCAAQVWGKVGGDLYLIDAWAKRTDFAGICEQVAALTQRYNVNTMRASRVEVVIEDRANGMALLRYLKTHEGLTNLRPFSPQKWGGKEQRASIASSWLRNGRIFLPAEDKTRPWVRYFVHELTRFPKGKHDDQIDAFSQAVVYMRRFGDSVATLGPTRAPAKPKGVW